MHKTREPHKQHSTCVSSIRTRAVRKRRARSAPSPPAAIVCLLQHNTTIRHPDTYSTVQEHRTTRMKRTECEDCDYALHARPPANQISANQNVWHTHNTTPHYTTLHHTTPH